MNEYLLEFLIYVVWMCVFQDCLVKDEFGFLISEFKYVEFLFIECVFCDVDGVSVWCDVIQSVLIEICIDVVCMVLDDVIIWINECYGDNFESLCWGDVYQVIYDYLVLGEVFLLWIFVNIC